MSITASSQQSRFHHETLETASKEIDLKGVTIAVGRTEVIADSHLRLKNGIKYALMGRNGSGKSTLLLALRDGLIPGLPANVRFELVSQTEADSTSEESKTISALQKVVNSDRTRARALKDFDELTKAVEGHDTEEIQRVVGRIELEKLKDELDVKRRIAARRSGARGKEARKEEEKAEVKLQEAAKHFEALALSEAKDPLEAAVALLADLQVTLDLSDYLTTEANAGIILTGLGFSQEMIDGPYTSLSGGWRSRCSLASALLVKSQVLLLDEPSNYLDLPATLWLESYLTDDVETTLVVTSHDQEFLNRVVDETIFIRALTLRYFEGTPAQWELSEKKERKKTLRAQGALDKKRSHIESTIRNAKATAKKSGDENKSRLASQRQKKLDERFGLEVNDKGHRFKLNRDREGYHTSTRADAVLEDQDPPVRIVLSDPAPLRTTGDLVTFDQVSFGYPRAKQKLLEHVSFSLPQGGRMAFVGANGQGKSTIANLILRNLKPSSGSVLQHPLLRKIGHYSQHSVEEVTQATRGTKTTALEYFIKYFAEQGIKVEEPEARAALGSLGLSGKTAASTAVESLSGGQKVRLAFSLVVFRPPPLLLLDEVTTHLDLATIQALADALRSYEGGLILVTHDRWFCRRVIEGATLRQAAASLDDNDGLSDADSSEEDEDETLPRGKVWRVQNAKVRLMEGGMDEYVEKVEKALAKRARLAAAAAAASR